MSRNSSTFRHSRTLINPNAIPGQPDTLEGVAHTQIVGVEPDLTRGEVADPKVNTHAHLEGTQPQVLMYTEDDGLLKVEEDGIAGENASVEEERDVILVSSC